MTPNYVALNINEDNEKDFEKIYEESSEEDINI